MTDSIDRLERVFYQKDAMHDWLSQFPGRMLDWLIDEPFEIITDEPGSQPIDCRLAPKDIAVLAIASLAELPTIIHDVVGATADHIRGYTNPPA